MRHRWQRALMMARLLGPYVAFLVLKRVAPLPTLARWAWRRPAGPRDAPTEAAALQCAVGLRNWLRAERGDCLHGSLALYCVLSRAGSNPTLVVGFRRDSAASIAGHAWVEVDDTCVVELSPALQGFVAAFAFGADGRLVTSAEPR